MHDRLQCPGICRLFAQILNHLGVNSVLLRRMHVSEMFLRSRVDDFFLYPNVRFVLYYRNCTEGSPIDKDIQAGVIHSSFDLPQQLPALFASEQNLAPNMEMAKMWLHSCCYHHWTTCGQPAAGSSHVLKVIDCKSERPVIIPAGYSYVALSYVRHSATWSTVPLG